MKRDMLVSEIKQAVIMKIRTRADLKRCGCKNCKQALKELKR